MKIAVCGCSFSACSTDEKYKGTHWSELLEHEVHNFARQGVSNSVIRLQIDEAIKIDPDLILINSTTTDRLDVPLNPRNGFDKQQGLKNFNYNTGPYTMLSETVFSLIDWIKHPHREKRVSPAIIESTKNYVAYLYDKNWRTQCDNWIINSGLWDLHERKIDFVYNHWIINHGEDNHHLPNWFVDRYLTPESLNFKNLMHRYYALPGQDPGYHTTIQGQQFIAAEYLRIIKERM
jgi:hypothetical protein